MSLLNLYEDKIQQAQANKSLLELVEDKMKRDKKETIQNIHGNLLQSVQSARSPHKINEEAFLAFARLHRAHQTEAIEAIRSHNKGQVIIPTGTGKTRVQIHAHVEDMIQKSKKDEHGVYVIGAHRLLLCTQLMDELRDLCIQCGIPVNVLYIGSARHDDKIVYDRYFHKGIDSDTYASMYTTSSEEVHDFYEKTMAQKRHLIVVSTYHSFHKMSSITSIDICTYDEAHITIQDDFSENIARVVPNIKRNYFFTATPKVHGEDKGMNNEEVYGEVICGVSPREMINKGEILRPRIHIMKLDEDDISVGQKSVDDNNQIMLIKTVIEGFTEHRRRLKEESAYSDKIGAKLLISARGSDELNILQSSSMFQSWCAANNVKFFSFSSRYGNYENFEEELNRTKVYENMRTLKNTDDCIFGHIDILTEGIDLPSITAVMLLRHLNMAKLMQTLGRGLRLLKEDRALFYKGEISPDDLSKYIKPHAYLMLPLHFETLNATGEDMKRMIQEILDTYGIPTEEFLPTEQFAAIQNEYLDPVTDIDKIKNKEKMFPLIHIIEDFVMDKFKSSLPDDKIEKYDALTELLAAFGGSDA